MQGNEALFILDGSQATGVYPLDLKRVKADAVIGAGYKWLFGPYSIALAYFGPAFDHGTPLEESWMNRTNARDFTRLTDYDPEYGPGASRYAMGEMSHIVTMPMLLTALNQVREWSPHRIQMYCRQLRRPLDEYLASNGLMTGDRQYFSDHILRLKLPAEFDAHRFQENIEREKIFISKRGDALRVSFNVFNTEEDISSLISALERSRY